MQATEAGRSRIAPATQVFDDERTKTLGDTFDAVCHKLHGAGYPDNVREAIADRVIETVAASAESDPLQLADSVIASLGIKL